MKVLFVHPSPLMYSELYLRLEPLGVERVSQAARNAGHEVRILDLQVFKHREYFSELADFNPHAIGFSVNYLANMPEIIDLAKATRERFPDCSVHDKKIIEYTTTDYYELGLEGLAQY